MNTDDEIEEFNNKSQKYHEIKNMIDENFEIGDYVRILKNRKLFSKGSKQYYSQTIYEIIEKNNNKFIVRSNDNKIKKVFPFEIKKIDDNIIDNPYVKNTNKNEKQQKKLKTDNEQINRTQKQLKNNENINVSKNQIK